MTTKTILTLTLVLVLTRGLAGAEAGAAFEHSIRPLLNEYCLKCHSTEKHKGDLDLQRFSSAVEIRKQPKVWQLVAEQLSNNEMPPVDKPQLSAAQKTQLAGWVGSMLDEIALAHAGDPGPVVLRRLSNAEYTGTVRDLTGVESLDPAREFPVDGAAGEGFTNTGQALVISPGLLAKYLDAGKEIANHAVLLPDGLRFSAKTSTRDRTDELLAQIRAFYAQFTDPSGGVKVDLQGIVFETNAGGRLPVEKYLAAFLAEREAPNAGFKSPEDVARARGLNAKYMRLLFKSLTGEPSLLLNVLRERVRISKAADAAALTAEIAAWQKLLWKFNSVGHIGKLNGPKSWLEPVTPLASKREVRFKLPPAPKAGTPGGSEVTLFLAATSIDAGAAATVLWNEPHFVAAGKPKILLEDVKKLGADLDAKNAAQPALPAPPALPKHWGLDAALFGKHPDGEARDAASLCVRAPAVLEIHLPLALLGGYEFVATGTLDKSSSADSCAQILLTDKAPGTMGNVLRAAPIVLKEDSPKRKELEAAFDDFRLIFPAALCYAKIVPVDEVVTLTLFYREDQQLARLMLDDAQTAQLDRLWEELHYVSRDALTMVDVFEQLWQYATQDADPKVFEPLREPIKQRAAAFKKVLVETEPRHVDAVLEFAGRAYRRPLVDAEKNALRALYGSLREQGLAHEQAIKLTLARVLIAPAFLYKSEQPAPGAKPGPVNDCELATRLSYFLWSSQPDAELRALADAGKLREPGVLAGQARRMIKDARVRRLATEFGCAWLHIHGFDELGEKSERHFPTFVALRGAMYEESIRFFADFFQNDRPVLNLLDADYTFLNEPLAQHYGIPGVAGVDWRRVEGVKKFSRGGILGEAATLAKSSGASRTSPILRGNWVAEALLGDKLPRPPKDVPALPADEDGEKLSVRQLTEKHSSDARCAVCHSRMDAFGFSLEGFDAIGRRRERDLGGRAIDASAITADGAHFSDIEGLRKYLLTTRREAFLRQFCRKLLGYALGRAVQLSDEPLLSELKTLLKGDACSSGVIIDRIVSSPQFGNIRGRDEVGDE